MTAKVNGFDAGVSIDDLSGNATVTYTFARTAAATVSSIEVSAIPAKTSYFVGDTLDLSGGKVTVSYEDGSSKVMDITSAMVSGFDSTKSGTQTVTVTYEGKTDSYSVSVKTAAVTGIEVSVTPSKTSYYVGDTLDLSGGKITVSYEDGSSKVMDITSAMVSGFDSTKSGTQTVTVTYEGKTDSFDVTVNEPEHEHNFSDEWAFDSTYHWHVCACGVTAELSKHIFGEGTITKESTETTEGVMTYTCQVCGYEKTKKIPVKEPSSPEEPEVPEEPEEPEIPEEPEVPEEPEEPAEKVNSFVERLYENVLGRPSDPSKVTHIDNLNSGKTAVKVAYDFVFSSEFTELDISNEERVRIMYLTFLDREPDPAGLATWTETLDNGCSVGHIFYGFTQSNEFTEICEEYGIIRGTWEYTENRDRSSKLTAFVSRLYTKAMGRNYDVNGLNDHTGNYLENRDLYQLAYNFIFSQEFIEKNLSDEEFVDVMYRTFFDREADPEGKADWLDRMANQGLTREGVLAGFVGSQECVNLVVKFGI
ncbi:MAG: DUF4214 domain-containing protein [Ruminococcus sp.]|nr:DUF4214 domain-containing protein [Ruminococcus sp.]